jgi:hypothetical protein
LWFDLSFGPYLRERQRQQAEYVQRCMKEGKPQEIVPPLKEPKIVSVIPFLFF